MSQTSIEIYNTVTDVKIIEVAIGSLVTTADLTAAVTSASGSATSAAASAASAISSKDLAESSAQSALESETSAASSAADALTSSQTSTTAASEAESSAISALESANAASASETSAASSATTATTQASIATSAASAALTSEQSAANSEQVAIAQATTATEQATIATTGANTATTQAGIATTAATAASASASQAASSAAQAAAVTLQQSFGRKFVPTISLDATSRTLPSYLSCTRAGVATFFDPSGVLRTANANEGRIDFDPVTGECLGLLSEGSATQFLPTSQTYNGFNGTTTTFLRNGETYFRYTPEPTINDEKIAYVKGVPVSFQTTGLKFVYGILKPTLSTNSASVTFGGIGGFSLNFVTKTITINAVGITIVSSSLQETSDGFFHIKVLLNFTNPPSFFRIYANPISGFDRRNCGLEYNYILLSNTVSSPIVNTTASPLTRPADLFATTGFQFSKRYNQNEGTFYVNTRAISDLTTTVAVFSDGTTNNETRLLANGTLTIRKGGVQIATIQATGATLNTHSIFGFTYKGTRIVITRNGTTVGVVTASEELATNYTTFQLGTGIYVRNLRYVPRVFSDSELQFVTNPLYFVGLEGDKVPTINDLSSGAFMEVQDLQTLRTRSEITIFGSGALRSIVINRPYPFLIEQVYVSPTGVTTATLPTLPTTGFYAANTDYTVLFNATADRTLVLAIIPQTIN